MTPGAPTADHATGGEPPPATRSARLPARLLREDLTRGAGVNLLFATLQATLGVVATAVAARALGPAGVGMVAIGLLLAELLSLLDNFPSLAFVRDHAGDPAPRTLATFVVTKAALGVTGTVLVLALAPVIARVFEVPVFVPIVFAFMSTVGIASSIALPVWEARRDMVRRNVVPVTEGALLVALYAMVAVGLADRGSPTLAISLCTVVATALAGLVGLATLPPVVWRAFDAPTARRYLAFGVRSQSVGTLQRLVFWLDIVLIDLWLGHDVQGLYKTAYTVAMLLPNAAAAVVIVMFPTVAAAHGRGEARAVGRMFSLGWFAAAAIALPLAALLVAFPHELLTAAMGDRFASAAPLVRGLALAGVLASLVLPFEAYFPAIGRPDLALRLAGIEAATNAVLDVILIPLWGTTGAIVAATVTFAVALATAAVLVRKLGHELPRWSHVVEIAEPAPVAPAR